MDNTNSLKIWEGTRMLLSWQVSWVSLENIFLSIFIMSFLNYTPKKWTLNEKFEDTKESVNLRKTDNTMAKSLKRINNDLQNITQKTKD
jgi:hypothetical protein